MIAFIVSSMIIVGFGPRIVTTWLDYSYNRAVKKALANRQRIADLKAGKV